MDTVKLRACAKINLTLDVTGKRPSGYHDVEMILQSVTLADTVEIALTNTGTLAVFCDDPRLPQGRENLAGRAAERFFEAARIQNPGVEIRIQKCIPDGAGLGGGSADAAAVLLGLNRLFGERLPQKTLARAALKVGADVPFCLRGGAMLARGLGEVLTPLPVLPDCFIVIARPEETVSTPAAYAAFDRVGTPLRPDTKAAAEALKSGNLSKIAASLGNALEQAAGLSAVASIKRRMLSCGAAGALMTGSGSAVFGLFGAETAAEGCAAELRAEYARVFVCRPAGNGCRFL